MYKKDWGKAVILVLCGEHDTNLVKVLQDAVKRHQAGTGPLDEFSIEVIVKQH